MKRKNNLYEKIVHKQNILKAHNNAKRGKAHYSEVHKVSSNLTKYIDKLHISLLNKNHKTSKYDIVTRVERGKERVIYRLPYFPDRIVHHALLQIMQPILEETLIKDTYQSIRGRGIHKAKDRLLDFLKDKNNTKYCLKIDIKKYYPSVDNKILKEMIRKKIKCKDTLYLVDEIVDSTKGLPIGNYTSQTFGNFYLSYFDHYIKEVLKIKYYIRYADDMIFLHNDKKVLHYYKSSMEKYLSDDLKLTLKSNWQIFPTNTRGIDFLGFRFFHDYTMLRKKIKTDYCKRVSSTFNQSYVNSIMSYYGWIKSCDCYNLMRKTISEDIILSSEKYFDIINKKNPLRKMMTIPKNNLNKFGKHQPVLF